MKTLIKNIRLITPYDILEGYSLAIENGYILDIRRLSEFDLDDFNTIIDGKGNYLGPGFIDIHNHGNLGFDIMDSSEEALDKIGEYHISNGVTSYLGTVITSSCEDMIKAMENIVAYENKNIKSNIIGIHLEGPFFNVINKGAQPEKHIKAPNSKDIKEILNIAGNKLKIVSLAPELQGALDVIKLLKENNIAISMAHSNATYEETKAGIENGITIATHLYNGMRGFNHREPGIIGASLTEDRVYCEIIYDRFHLHDIAVKIALRKAFYNMVNFLQVPINEAVKMASLNPAKAIKVDKEIGSIEIGKKADLILLDDNINIINVYLGGNLVWKEN